MEKPNSKIIDISKLKIKAFALSDEQSEKTQISLGDVITIEVKARVIRCADEGENLFAFSKVYEVDQPIAYMTGIKPYQEILKERDAKEKEEMQRASKSQQKRVKALTGQ
jgi:hypothetical protein